ncbi:MAG: selenocysteine-specific translation elongation factor [Planctomycetota bacterium]|jgi:selenocysteine-specific elongation factor
MSVEQANITLGTAGHIDHGKTALVKCLTGCDTDRLKAEKERGMSIDLGFAPCMIADMQVGIVDVPGHENFVKTMVAGATGIDGVILVVAADDAVMPQTREHLDILTLLGVEHGMVALTKVDRVEADHMELAREDVTDLVEGTFLQNAPILPVSSVTGEGFDRFLEALVALVEAIRPKPVDGVFRLPLDRAFSVQGYGTVVAGIPVSGSARAGDEVVLLPRGLEGRIRRIEVYGRTSDQVLAGQCAALNVGHWDHHAVARGDTLAVPGYFSAERWYLCELEMLPHEKLALKSGTQVKFHTGTSEMPAAVYPLRGDLVRAGERELVQIRVNEPVVAGPGDHFILRTLSPVQTVGGGMVVEATPRRLKRNRPNVHEDAKERAAAVGDESRFVEYCVRKAESLAAGPAELAVRTKIPQARVEEILAGLTRREKLIPLGPNLSIHRDTAAAAAGRVLDVVARFHQGSPESPGIALEPLRIASRLEKAVADGVIALLKTEGKLVEDRGRLAAAEHQATFSEQDAERLETIESLFRQHPFQPPGTEELAGKTGAAPKDVERLLGILREHERLVPVGDGLLFHRQAVDRAREILVDFLRKEGKLESVRFKYLLDTTRKFAIPLLDHLDRLGITRREGNTRFLKT